MQRSDGRARVMKTLEQTACIYQLKVTLKRNKPSIWRRIQVNEDTALFDLHCILQEVMGWTNSHLHQFIIDGRVYSHPDFEMDERGDEILDERKFRLMRLPLQEKTKFIYEYDFGDDWVHELLVEKVLPVNEKLTSPICLEGRMACPPEDCGGIWGYADFIKAIKDPKHPEHKSMREWIGGDFDPEAFDLEEVNESLRDLKKNRYMFEP